MQRVKLSPNQVRQYQPSARRKHGRASEEKMRKGRAFIDVRRVMAGRKLRMAKAWDPSFKPITWNDDDVTFIFRKATTGVGVLTARWPGAAMPYHIVAPDLHTARSDAMNVIDSLRKGKTPSRGVYRREALASG